MGNKASKTRIFTVELKSKAYLKNIMMTNGNSSEGVMIEGALGELKRACFAEGVILEVVGANGVLRVDLRENEISKSRFEDPKEAK
jgi:hypothetical protein